MQQFACDDYYWYGNVGCNDPSMFFQADYESEQTTHEIRVNSTGDGPLTWIAGAYFEDNSSDNFIFWDMQGFNTMAVPGPTTQPLMVAIRCPTSGGARTGSPNGNRLPSLGEVSYDVTDRLTATVGARMFESEFSSPGGGWAGYFYNSKASDDAPSNSGSTDDMIYKFNLTYDVSDNLLAFFNYAEDSGQEEAIPKGN